MVAIETETAETKIAIVTGMVAAAADEMMIMARENDTMKVMGTMTREAKEGTKARPCYQCINRASRKKHKTVCRWVPGCVHDSSQPHPLTLNTCRMSFETKNSTVCWWVHYVSVLVFDLLESISSLLLARG
jgi:hypothetical protein